MFYREHNFTLNNDMHPNVPLIPQNVKIYKKAKKTNAMILPVFGKSYHTVRNWSQNMVVNLINSIPFDKFDNIFIINKDNYQLDLHRIITNINKNVILIEKETS